MIINTTSFRKNLFSVLDEVIEKGKTVEISRKGKKVILMPEKKSSKLKGLIKQSITNGDPESLVHIDWSDYWDEGRHL